MDLQFYGANCLTVSSKRVRLVFDDNLSELGGKSVSRQNDVVIFSSFQHPAVQAKTRLLIDGPGEYEVGDCMIQGIAVRAHMDEAGKKTSILYKVSAGDLDIVVTGHIYPELTDNEMERIGLVDVLCIPVGGNGYTVDGAGALSIIKKIEPKIVIPTHYADEKLNYPVPQAQLSVALHEMAMDVTQELDKLRLRAPDLPPTTQLIVLKNE